MQAPTVPVERPVAAEAAVYSRHSGFALPAMRSLVWPVAIYIASRIATLVAARVATWSAPPLRVSQALSGWDGSWYLMIARSGYPSHLGADTAGDRWAFFPGFPAVIHVVAAATGLSYTAAGIAVATLFGLTATIAVWLAVRQVMGETVARGTAALLCFFPTAYTLGMVYTEGMFITFAALTVYLLGERRWAWAGLAAGLAGVTRSVGIVLALVCATAALEAVVRRREWRALTAVVLAPTGFAAWCAVQAHVVGTPFAFSKAEDAWGGGFVWFTTPFKSLGRVVSGTDAWRSATDVEAAGAVLLIAIALVLLIRHHLRTSPLPSWWWVFTGGMILAALSPYWPTSVLRYTMPAFPLLAVLIRSVPARFHSALIGSSGVIQGALAVGAFVGIVHWQTAPFAP